MTEGLNTHIRQKKMFEFERKKHKLHARGWVSSQQRKRKEMIAGTEQQKTPKQIRRKTCDAKPSLFGVIILCANQSKRGQRLHMLTCDQACQS